MSRDKKSKVDDITKLRKILDNPSDPETKKLISGDEKALNSIQKRLADEPIKTPVKSESFPPKYNTFEPKITIRAKNPPPPEPTAPLPIFQPVPIQPVEPVRVQPRVTLPEFELVSTPAPMNPTPLIELLFANEALYEIEKTEPPIPEFYEVTPSEIPQKTLETKTTMNHDEQSIQNHHLPEWQPLEENQPKEPQEKSETTATVEFQQVDPELDSTPDDTSTNDTIPEFEPIETPSPQTVEKPDEWTILPSKEQPKETPIEFQSTEPLPAPVLQLTKKQEREAKKTEKRKEKEEKKQKKLELKKLKKETREKEREAQRLASEQQSIQQQPEPQPVQPEPVAEEKPPQMKIDITAFKGMETIDEKTAELLYKNGYFSIDNLQEATIDDLVQIHGIKRKLAKQIKKEVQEKTTTPPEPEFVPIKGKAHKTQIKETSDDITEWESYHVDDASETPVPLDVSTYESYTLYKQTTSKERGKKTTIHFFSKEKPADSVPTSLPDGYQIAVNKKTGVPYLKKKK